METGKKELRRQFKEARDRMYSGQAAALSEMICGHVISSPAFVRAERVFAYYPLGNEVDVRDIVREAWRQGKQVAFPKVFGNEMSFFEIGDFQKLHPGTFGVMEPEETCPADWSTGLMLVPGVAFDRGGNRMGFGKGYYDRYLARHPGCICLGMAYELQVADRIPTEETDVPLHCLVTEKGILNTGSQQRGKIQKSGVLAHEL